MAVTFRDYSGDVVEAAHSVLLELVRLLGEYRDDLVVVGGWVPQLILPSEPLNHVGSVDVDLAFNHRNLRDDHDLAEAKDAIGAFPEKVYNQKRPHSPIGY